MKVCIKFFIILFFLLNPLYANELPTKKSALERYLEAFHTQVTPLENALLWVVDETDALFSGNREEVDTLGKSHATLRLSSYVSEGQNILYDVKVKAHLSLPKTKDRLKLVFQSDDKDDYVDEAGESNPKEAVENKDYLLGLEFFRPREDILQYRFSVGMKLRSPLDPYGKLRLQYTPEWFPTWDFALKQTFSYYYHRGFESKSSASWSKELWKKWFFTHYNGVYYEEDDEQWQSVHAVTFSHPLRRKQRVALDLSSHLSKSPTQAYQLTHYQVRFGYHKQLTKEFAFEAIPSMTLPKSDDFKPSAAFRVNLLYKIGRH